MQPSPGWWGRTRRSGSWRISACGVRPPHGSFRRWREQRCPAGQAARHPALADAVAFRRPITLTRPNTVVKAVRVLHMIEQRDDSIAQFYVSRTRGLNTTGERTNGYRIYELRSSSAATSPTRSLTKDASITMVSPL